MTKIAPAAWPGREEIRMMMPPPWYPAPQRLSPWRLVTAGFWLSIGFIAGSVAVVMGFYLAVLMVNLLVIR